MIERKKFTRPVKKAPVMTNNTKYRQGDVVTLKVARVSDAGAFLDAGTGNTSDDILLHKLQQTSEVKVGDEVKAGDTLLVLEAMKMANNIEAEKDGKVTAICVKAGQSVMEDDALVVIE